MYKRAKISPEALSFFEKLAVVYLQSLHMGHNSRCDIEHLLHLTYIKMATYSQLSLAKKR